MTSSRFNPSTSSVSQSPGWRTSPSREATKRTDLYRVLRADVHRYRLVVRPVYEHAKAPPTGTREQVLRQGLSPQATTISVDTAARVIAGIRLRAGRTGTGEGEARIVAKAFTTDRSVGARGMIIPRAAGILAHPLDDRLLPGGPWQHIGHRCVRSLPRELAPEGWPPCRPTPAPRRAFRVRLRSAAPGHRRRR